jgi:hypothetical protein
VSQSATRLGVIIAGSFLACLSVAGEGPEPLPAAMSLGIAASQVTIAIDEHDPFEAFRATVLAIDDDVFTVLTAARFVDKVDQARPAQLLLEGGAIEGMVLSVARNPAFRPEGSRDVAPTARTSSGPAPGAPSAIHRSRQVVTTRRLSSYPSAIDREVPGADNAIVRIWFPDRSGQTPVDLAFRKIRTVPSMTASFRPALSGGTVTARMIDRFGREHAVLACNFTNPRLLAWGHSYNPRRSEAGGGVFTLREGSDGRPQPTLIGVLHGPDVRGGCASLVALDMPWVAAALNQGSPGRGSAQGSSPAP